MSAPKGNKNNLLGKGGFQERPQDINKSGHWDSTTSISFNQNKLIRCSVEEFKKWLEAHPESTRTMAQELAYQSVMRARKDLAYLKEVSDRTEGKPKVYNEVTGKDGESLMMLNSDPRIIETLIKTVGVLKRNIHETAKKKGQSKPDSD